MCVTVKTDGSGCVAEGGELDLNTVAHTYRRDIVVIAFAQKYSNRIRDVRTEYRRLILSCDPIGSGRGFCPTKA